jgi:hypothetical protein
MSGERRKSEQKFANSNLNGVFVSAKPPATGGGRFGLLSLGLKVRRRWARGACGVL